MVTSLNESTLRTAVHRKGYRLEKSRRRTPATVDDRGGYTIVDGPAPVGKGSDSNWRARTVVAGERFDLTLEDVRAWLNG